MNNDQDKITDRSDPADDARDETLSALLRLAGPSDEIPDEIRDRVYANARAELRQPGRLSQSWRWALPLATAASILMVVLLNGAGDGVTVRPVGSVVLAKGTAADPGQEIRIGDTLDTGPNEGLSIELSNGISLRVDEETVLMVESVKEFNLIAGRVYVDTGDRIYPTRNVTVRTASGKATDIGTQFSVQFERADMSVAVREGRVDLSGSGELYTANRGDLATLRPGTAVLVETVPVTGSTWDWAVSLAPEFELENRSLLEFLKWAAREAGLELAFESNVVMTDSMKAIMHGSIEGLSPLQAIESVLATTPFQHSIEDDRLVISKH